MKALHNFAIPILFITLFTSCKSGSDPSQMLLNKKSRAEIMDTISNSHEMGQEMMAAMMNSENGKMIIQDNDPMSMMMMNNHTMMQKMMKENPAVMQSMMMDMMASCKGDSTMMAGMCKTMMGDQQMMDMMHNMNGKMDINQMEGMKHKMQ